MLTRYFSPFPFYSIIYGDKNLKTMKGLFERCHSVLGTIPLQVCARSFSWWSLLWLFWHCIIRL